VFLSTDDYKSGLKHPMWLQCNTATDDISLMLQNFRQHHVMVVGRLIKPIAVVLSCHQLICHLDVDSS